MEKASTRWLTQRVLNTSKRATEKRRGIDRYPLPTDRPTESAGGLVGKKNHESCIEAKRALIEPGHPDLSIVRQCELLGLARSSYYYEPVLASEENLHLMRLLDEQYTRTH